MEDRRSNKINKICKVDNCDNIVFSSDYCNKHYTQIRKYGKIKERTKFDPNEIIIYDDYAEIILYNRKCEEVARTIIDVEDVDKCKLYKWYLKGNYVATSYNKTKIYLHHYILNIKNIKQTKLEVDHKDRNKLNNKKDNLRVTSININRANINARKDNKYGIKGVYCFERTDKWRVNIKINKKSIHLGYFEKLEDAVKARKEAENKYYGEGVLYESN